MRRVNDLGNKLRDILRNHAFYIFWVSGLFSILMDASDHIPFIFEWVEDGRFLHIYWITIPLFYGLLFKSISWIMGILKK